MSPGIQKKRVAPPLFQGGQISKVIVRAATERDLSVVAAINRQALIENASFTDFITQEEKEGLLQNAKRKDGNNYLLVLRNAQNNSKQCSFQIAEHPATKEILGYMIVEQAENKFEIKAIYVKPEARGQNVSLALQRNQCQWMSRQAGDLEKQVELAVIHYAPALKYYEKLGFKAVEGVTSYLPYGIRLVTMQIPLKTLMENLGVGESN